ncbi:MAG: anthranilate synthase component I family protein [Chitinophagaceae bacterium]|nr:anthranilate synthase component I family protein [Chitinophagaceae bacterium]
MLRWADRRNILLFLDSNGYVHTQGSYECICAAGVQAAVPADDGLLSALNRHYDQHRDWLFGHIAYDFKNRLEHLHSGHPDHLLFPELYFFRPEIVCYIKRGTHALWIETLGVSPETVWNEIQGSGIAELAVFETLPHFQQRFEHEAYLRTIEQLKEHIRNGDCYEINFCNERYCTDALIHPVAAFERLTRLSPAPFAAYYRLDDKTLMCASPERYLRKQGHTILAQPIKGTARRDADPVKDAVQKNQLRESLKEQAENVMIVDLMRNDLARFCATGSVQVDELFGLYSFPQVHQMISTVSGTLRAGLSLFEALRCSFPMGSMTGAPKVMVMKLIEQYERAYRGLFSGSVGYISPEGDFDFNVVIRSLLYNSSSRYLSYQTGGAITYNSDAEQEWQETLLKGAALQAVFQK